MTSNWINFTNWWWWQDWNFNEQILRSLILSFSFAVSMSTISVCLFKTKPALCIFGTSTRWSIHEEKVSNLVTRSGTCIPGLCASFVFQDEVKRKMWFCFHFRLVWLFLLSNDFYPSSLIRVETLQRDKLLPCFGVYKSS